MTMYSSSLSSLLCLVFAMISLTACAFQPRMLPLKTASSSTTTQLFYNEHPERANHRVMSNRNRRHSSYSADQPIECFLVIEDNDNEDDDGTLLYEYQKPRVVCTSEPDEYAWFNGLDRDQLIPTDGTETGSMECVEGASPRGIPEWECE